MNEKKGNFPAFPCVQKVITGYIAEAPISFGNSGTVNEKPIYEEIQHYGMTLRDYFAAKAMQGYCTSKDFSEIPWEKIARLSYMQADAMLAERKK